ncbi:MAG: class I SAM-dependent methyltransferase [Myxococcaceae bacterium]|nr:class I SAM-dependent methyltransferase [Myxococcaceae bacterium]
MSRTRKQAEDWYRHPKYYEAIFGADTARELDFLEAVNALYGTGGRTWLEPACGAGGRGAAAARRGYTLIGYDVSPEMLAHARQRLPPSLRRRVHLSLDRMESFAPRRWRGRVDLAFNLVSTFRYLDSEEAALSHLRHTRELLRPEGVYVLGFHLTDYARTTVEHERWVGRVGQEGVICNTREWPPDRRRRRSRMRNRLEIIGPRGRRRIETNWYFRTWNEREAEVLLTRAGFQLVGLYTFDAAIDEPISWDSNRLDRILILARR